MPAALLLLALLLLPAWDAADAQAAPRWTSVSTGAGHACALDATGRAFCWGDNASGQLGARTPLRCGALDESARRGCFPPPSEAPVAVRGARRFTALAAGEAATCALDGAGRAFCWGGGVPGSRSRCVRDAPCTFEPLEVHGKHRFRVLRQTRAGLCGVTLGEEALCASLPAALGGDTVATLRGEMTRVAIGVRAVDAFSRYPIHNLCVVGQEGGLRCRGSNGAGQLGIGTRPWTRGSDPRWRADSLVRVDAGGPVQEVVVMWQWASALGLDGRVHTWGIRSVADHAFRDTPDDPRWCREFPCATRPEPLAAVPRLTGLSRHASEVCGLTAEGEAWCWGLAGRVRRVAPELRFSSLAGYDRADSRSCGVTRGGELWCWTTGATPVRVPHPRRASRG